MKKDLYNNNEEEFEHVIKLLKALPKEKAPENFEYNLKVKIENKNFELNTKENSIFSRWNVFIPAFGAVAASIIIFFTVFSNSDSIENPFQVEPKLRNALNSSSTQFTNVISKLSDDEKISENDVVLKAKNDISPKQKLSVKQNDVKNIAHNTAKKSFPFKNYQSTNLDEVLSNGQSRAKANPRAQLATRSNSNFFNGFFIREEVDKEYVEALKARMDSLKKVRKMELKRIHQTE